MFTRVMIAVSALLFGSSALVGIGFSGATWTHVTSAPATVAASPDWTPPSVTVSPLAAGIFGTTTVTATAVDERSGIGSVTLEYLRSGGTTWTPISTGCTASSGSSPLVYSCQWDTTTVATPDGDYQVRARTTDTASPVAYSATSAAVPTQIANSTSVVLTTVPDHVRGTVSLTAGFLQPVSGTTRLYIDYLDGTTWTQIPGCTSSNTQSLTCSWNTTTFANGPRDLRGRAEKGSQVWTDEQTGVVVDNQAPTVDSFTVPPGVLSGVVTLAATASDSVSSVASVSFDYQLGSGSWNSCGTDTSAPYTCNLTTVGLPDGSYTFRATATDAAGNTSVPATQSRTVSNAASSVSITSPAPSSTVGGASVPVAVSASSDRGVTSVRVDFRTAGGTFTEACTDTTAPYSCNWNAAGLGNGSYELRAVMTETSGGATVTSSVVAVTVNNSLGTVYVAAPLAGTTLSGTTSVTATANAASGATVTSVSFEAGPVGGPYVSVCGPVSAPPYTCAWNTSTVTYAANYELRAVMQQSNLATVTSSVVTVSVDNVVASLNVSSPTAGARVRGSAVSVAATTSVSTAGVTVSSVKMEWRAAGGTFATLCTDSLAPYGCTWDTTGITYGSYELRSVMTLSNGATRTSGTVGVTVDNRVLAAADIQATNGNGAPVAGDTLVFTYSSLVNLATIRGSAWDGSTSVPINLEFMDVNKSGNNTGKDAIQFTNSQLGWVTFAQNYVTSNSTVTVPASMTASNASGVTVVTVVLGAVPTNGNKVVADSASGAMGWLPSTTVTDIFATACSGTAATESGTSDADF